MYETIAILWAAVLSILFPRIHGFVDVYFCIKNRKNDIRVFFAIHVSTSSAVAIYIFVSAVVRAPHLFCCLGPCSHRLIRLLVENRMRGDPRPFGGIQLVLCGDFFQLPPIGIGRGTTRFCFEARTWDTSVDESIVLKQVRRRCSIATVPHQYTITICRLRR